MDSYRSLLAWQRAHDLCLTTLRATDKFYHPRSRPLFDQLRRAVISVEANIVEGYTLGTPRQFKRYLQITIGSLAEVECLLELARELEYLDAVAATCIREKVAATFPVLVGLSKHVQKTVSGKS